jgi:adenosylcobinamide-GDP ribazoletransferase
MGAALALASLSFGFLPVPVNAALIVIASLAISGAIHLDGFADTCDGFYGDRPKEKILEIMRDSRVGAMGVAGIVCLLLLKFSLILCIPRESLWKALIAMMIFSRWSQVFACRFSKYARDEGKAKLFMLKNNKNPFLIAAIFTAAVFVLFYKLNGAFILLFSLLPIVLFIDYSKRKIGGMTGDTIGAASEIAEVSVLLFSLIYQ